MLCIYTYFLISIISIPYSYTNVDKYDINSVKTSKIMCTCLRSSYYTLQFILYTILSFEILLTMCFFHDFSLMVQKVIGKYNSRTPTDNPLSQYCY